VPPHEYSRESSDPRQKSGQRSDFVASRDQGNTAYNRDQRQGEGKDQAELTQLDVRLDALRSSS